MGIRSYLQGLKLLAILVWLQKLIDCCCFVRVDLTTINTMVLVLIFGQMVPASLALSSKISKHRDCYEICVHHYQSGGLEAFYV